MPKLWWCVVMTCCVGLHHCEESLIFTSREKNNYGQGIFAGPIDVSNNGSSAGDLTTYGYTCWKNGWQSSDLLFMSVSYDPVTTGVLLHIPTDYPFPDYKVTLAKGNVCTHIKPKSCDNHLEGLDLIADKWEQPHGKNETFGPFAMYDSTIYYIYTKISNKGTGYKIELKRMDQCEGNKLELSDSCTSTLATLLDVKGSGKPAAHLEPFSEYGTVRTLAVKDIDRELVFFTQIENRTYTRLQTDDREVRAFSLKLVAIRGDGSVHELHHQEESAEQLEKQWLLYSGGIDYKYGRLCWSTYEKLFCGQLNKAEFKLTGVEKYMDRLVINLVCPGGNRASGVAIPEGKKDGPVIFGCDNTVEGSGGIGLIYPPNEKGVHGKIYAVKSQGGNVTIRGGAVIMTDCKKKPAAKLLSVVSAGTYTAPSLIMICVQAVIQFLY